MIETDEWIKSIIDKENSTNGLFSPNIIVSYIELFNRSIIFCFYDLQLQSPVATDLIDWNVDDFVPICRLIDRWLIETDS